MRLGAVLAAGAALGGAVAGCGGRSELFEGSLDAGFDVAQPTVDASVPTSEAGHDAGHDAGMDSYVAPPDSATCGPSNCTGNHCCEPDGSCVVATAEACGSGGAACVACPAAYPKCAKDTGNCATDIPGGCLPGNCGGCCQAIPHLTSDECEMGTSNQACGTGGALCSACTVGTCTALQAGGGVCGGQ